MNYQEFSKKFTEKLNSFDNDSLLKYTNNINMNRLKNNLEILKQLKLYFVKNPHIRFFQGLWNLKIIESKDNLTIIDKYNQEPDVTLLHLKD